MENTNELDNLYELARSARDSGDDEQAYEYYCKVAEKDANSWEALVYIIYATMKICPHDELKNVLENFIKYSSTILNRIKEHVEGREKQICAVKEATKYVLSISNIYFERGQRDKTKLLTYCLASYITVLTWGDYIEETFGDHEELHETAVDSWKGGIEKVRIKQSFMKDFGLEADANDEELIQKYTAKIQKYGSSYQTPSTEASVNKNIKSDVSNSSMNVEKISNGEFPLKYDQYSYVRPVIAVGGHHIVGVKEDGTVIAKGRNSHGQCDVENWMEIVAVYASSGATVGLKKTGTVVTLGYNDRDRQRMMNWSNIVAISAGWHTVGLKKDGKVVAVGENRYGECDVTLWSKIEAISIDSHYTVGLRKNGTVVAVGSNEYGKCDVGHWKNIVAICAGGTHTVGLKKDGTVTATGSTFWAVDKWRDIVAISAGCVHTVGLKKDGTVVATGDCGHGECNVESWRDIVAISTGWSHTVGLKKDGTVVAVGENKDGQCNVGSWRDIVAIYTGEYNTVGLKKDGTVIATGSNTYGQCDVGEFKIVLEDGLFGLYKKKVAYRQTPWKLF